MDIILLTLFLCLLLHENKQSQESVLTAKIAFRAFKNRIRLNLASTHSGPESLEEAVQCYINRNLDLYDLPGIVQVTFHGLMMVI